MHPKIHQFFDIGIRLAGNLARPIVLDLNIRNAVRLDRTVRGCFVEFEDEPGKPGYKTITGVVLQTTTSPSILAHEFGHCIHCHYWPDLSLTITDEVAERFADYASWRYATRQPTLEWLLAWKEKLR